MQTLSNELPLLVLDQHLQVQAQSAAWPVSPEPVKHPLDRLHCVDGRDLGSQLIHHVRDEAPLNSPLLVEVDGRQQPLHIWRLPVEQGWHIHLLLEREDPDLAHLRSTHALILRAAGEGIYGLDKEGRATFANAASTRILGWRAEDILGKKTHALHHHSHADGRPYPDHECPIYAALKDGEIHRVDDEVFWHADGTPVPVEYISTPIVRDGQIDGAVIVFRDIRERQAYERQRDAAYEEIRQLKEALEQERDLLRQEVQVTRHYDNIIGNSPALARTLSQIEAVSATPSNVLILGESGVGKEMIARAIHQHSQRADGPLIKVNCASVPKDLFESEFFGHIRGAFTGAHKDRIGRLQLAHEGSLFLDEVGEIPLDLQSKLLRALQEQEFERVGDERTQSVDVRIIAATNRDLLQEVKAGRFREDLYYRLSVFPIEVPPLRQRKQDIPLLAQHFLDLNCQELGRPPLRLSRQHAQTLAQHTWPGNIRELKNVMERATILSSHGVLRLEQALPEAPLPALSSPLETEADSGFYTEAQMRELEKNNLRKALRACGGKIAGPQGAAAALGLKPSTLTYRLQQLGLR